MQCLVTWGRSSRFIAGAGAFVALGFLGVSAVANFTFGESLGRTPWEAKLYGSVGVFAVAMNALAPFYISWSLSAGRKTAAASIAFLWLLCLTYSTTSALGFAAQNRESIATARQVTSDAYDDTRRELVDLEGRRQFAKPRERVGLDNKIDDARKRLAGLREQKPAPADAQSSFLSSISFGLLEPKQVRTALVALFALMVEVGATLGLFAALSHSPPPSPPPAPPSWRPKAS
jgi:hypothetical protein